MTCTNDCNQGRACDCPPMIAPKTRDVFDWWLRPCDIITPETPAIWQHLWDYAVGFLAALGAVGLAACIGLYLGRYFEFLMKELSK